MRNAVQGEAATQFNDLDRKLDVRVRATEDERSMVSRARQPRGRTQRGHGRAARRGRRRHGRARPGRDPAHRPAARRGRSPRTWRVATWLRPREDIEAVARGHGRCRRASASTLAGQNRELAESFGSLRFALLLAVFLVYLVMASQFESLLHPFVIMFTLPMAVIGVVLALVLTGTSISVMVLIGLVVLAGIVVNNAHRAGRLRQPAARRAGARKLDALVEAGSVRLRPILMTTLTTVLGLVPMALGDRRGRRAAARRWRSR